MNRYILIPILFASLVACEGRGAGGPIASPGPGASGRDAGGRDAGGRTDAGGVDGAVVPTCDPHAAAIGGQCRCNTGYEGDGTTCRDVDECAVASACPAHSTCANNDGDYDCFCDGGFTPSGTECVAIACAPCSVDGRCGGAARCLQRYCDGRFGCYTEPSCGTIGGTACTAAGAWDPCAGDADCPADFQPNGALTLQFTCVAFGSTRARCWPLIRRGNGQVEPPPATERLECPPAPPDTTGLTVEPGTEGLVPEWETPPMEGGFHIPTYRVCHLACGAGDVCPDGMSCTSGRCK